MPLRGPLDERAKLPSPVLAVLLVAVLAAIALGYSTPVLADGPSISLTSSVSILQCVQGIGNETCYYPVTPGMVLPLAGSGFAASDTTITFSGIPSDVNPTQRTCNVTNRAFTCNFVVPDVPTVDESRYSLTATGNTGDSASLLVSVGPGVGIYPTSGPPGTVVTVYGDNFIGQKSIVFDSTAVVTFGTDEPSGLTGTGPAVIDNNIPAQYTCVPGKDGSLSDYGACTFAVPPFIPGYYNVGVLVALDYSVPDPLACGSKWCVSEFRITPPAISVNPPETLPGSTVQVTGSSFAGDDTSASIFLDGILVTPSSGCPVTQSPSGGTISCTIMLPSSITAPGPHHIVATGIQYGDSGTASFALPGPYPLSPSTIQATPGSIVTVQGIAYDPSDTLAEVDLGGQNSSCPISYGSFTCPIAVPSSMTAGTYTLQITGNTVGDYDTASLVVVPSLAINPPSAAVDTQVTLSSLGFRGDTASAALNDQSLPLTLTSGGQSTPGLTCPVSNGVFPPSGDSCYFTVPASALPGANTLTLTDNFGKTVSSTFTLIPSITLSQSQASVGQTITVTGYGFPAATQIDGFEIGGLISYADPGSCVASPAGTISCSLVVPDRAPGTYTFSAEVLEQGLGDQPLASTTFTLVPSVSMVYDTSGVVADDTAPAGAAIQVNINGFYADEHYAQVWLDDQLLPLLEGGCTQNPPVGLGVTTSLSCTVRLPDVTPGPHILKAVGEAYGEAATTTIYISGLALSPSSGQANTLLDVKGYGLYLTDTSAGLTIGGASPSTVTDASTGQSGCPVTSGSFDCQFDTPVLGGGAQPVVATGPDGDQATTNFTVVPTVVATAPSGIIGSLVTLQGNGFLSSDSAATVSFNDQNIGTCVPSGGAFNCAAFSVPAVAPGTYIIGAVGNSGNPMDIATANYTVVPAPLTITANGASSAYGQTFPQFTATYSGFLNGDTPSILQGTLAITTPAQPVSPPGTYPLTPGGVSSPNYAITFVNGTLTITQAGTSVQLSTSVKGRIHRGADVTLTVRVVSDTTGTPTGIVTFLDGSATISSTGLSQGTATVTTNALPQGIDSITARYGGDSNFAASTSAVETVSVNAPDYTVSANPSALTLSPGQSGSSTLTITSEGFSGTVAFSCGSLPSHLSCAFNPSSGQVTVSGGSPKTATVVLTVSAASSLAAPQRRGPNLLETAVPVCLLGCLPIIAACRKRVRSYILLAVLAAASAVAIAGCRAGGVSSGGGTAPPSPSGQQTFVTVTTTGSSPSGTIFHQLQVTITVTN